MAAKPTAPFVLALSGQVLPLLKFVSAKGNECFGVLAKKANGERYLSPYGVAIPALAAEFPTSAVLSSGDGTSNTQIELTHGETEKGAKKVSFNGKLDLPGVGERNVRINVSLTKNGDWNLIAKVIPVGAGGGKTTDVADLW